MTATELIAALYAGKTISMPCADRGLNDRYRTLETVIERIDPEMAENYADAGDFPGIPLYGSYVLMEDTRAADEDQRLVYGNDDGSLEDFWRDAAHLLAFFTSGEEFEPDKWVITEHPRQHMTS